MLSSNEENLRKQISNFRKTKQTIILNHIKRKRFSKAKIKFKP